MSGIAGYLTLTIGLLVVGCGVEEVAPTAPGNLSNLRRPSSPNTCLAGPPGFIPTPDLPTRRYDVLPEKLLAVVQDVIVAQPRTTAVASDSGRLRADYVVRSRVFGFPDVVLTQVLRLADGQSALVLYSYSLKGRYDFGVNRRRVTVILTAIDAALDQPR